MPAPSWVSALSKSGVVRHPDGPGPVVGIKLSDLEKLAQRLRTVDPE